jgi:hypothetical protein
MKNLKCKMKMGLKLCFTFLLFNVAFLIGLQAQTSVKINLSATVGQYGITTTNRTCFVYYVSSPGANASSVVLSDVGSFVTDSNSSFTVALPAIGDYRVKVLPPPTTAWFQFSITNLNLGLVTNIVPYLTVSGAPTYPSAGATAYTMAAADARFSLNSNVLGSSAFVSTTNFQSASTNLTNFALYNTNSFQSASSTLSNYALYPTNTWQPASSNLTNWSGVSTNQLAYASQLGSAAGLSSNALQAGSSVLSNWALILTNLVVYQSQIGTAAASAASAFQPFAANLTAWASVTTNSVVYPSQLGSAAYSNSASFQPASANLTSWSGFATSAFAQTNSLGTAAYATVTAFQTANSTLSNWAGIATNLIVYQSQIGTAASSNSSAFQAASANLTNFALYNTNSFQSASSTLSNYALYPTNTWQPASSNLTNWALLSTNVLTNFNGSAGGTFQPANTVLTNLSTNNAGSLTNLNALVLMGLIPSTNIGGSYSNAVNFVNTNNQFYGGIQLAGPVPTFKLLYLVDGGPGFSSGEIVLCTNADASTVAFYSSPNYAAPFYQWTLVPGVQQQTLGGGGYRWTIDISPASSLYYIAVAFTNTSWTDFNILYLQANGNSTWSGSYPTDIAYTGLLHGGWGADPLSANGGAYIDGFNNPRIRAETGAGIFFEGTNGLAQLSLDGGTNVFVPNNNSLTVLPGGKFIGNGGGITNLATGAALPAPVLSGTPVWTYPQSSGTVGSFIGLSANSNIVSFPNAAYNTTNGFTGNGAGLTNLQYASITGLSTNAFAVTNDSRQLIFTNTTSLFYGSFLGSGLSITGVLATNITGLNTNLFTLTNDPRAVTLTNVANTFTGLHNGNGIGLTNVQATNIAGLNTNLFALTSALGSAAYSNSAAFYPASNPSNFISSASGYIPQLSGTGTNLTTAGTNILGGKNLFPMWANTTLANGNNAATSFGTNNYVRFTGPTAAFTNAGFAGGTNGAWFWALNATPQPWTILNDSGQDIAGNRIYTSGLGNVTLSNQFSLCLFVYDSTSLHWVLGFASGQTVFNGLFTGNFNGNFSGNGAGLTNIPAFANSNQWSVLGNAGMTSTNYIGTLNNAPTTIIVNQVLAAQWLTTFVPGIVDVCMAPYDSVHQPNGNHLSALGGNVISGGSANAVTNNGSTIAQGDVVAGGYNNTAGYGQYASVGGGFNNIATGVGATIPGGQNNYATNGSFAAGQNANATNINSFVWSDGTLTAQTGSTNQFVIHAMGGAFISSFAALQNWTNGPTAAQLGPYGSGFWSSNGIVYVSIANSAGNAISTVKQIAP